MAIDVTGNTVNFGTYTISATPNSIIINGKLRAAGCAVIPSQAQGSVSGYSSGGSGPTNNSLLTIDKFPFATDTNATDVGDRSVCGGGAGQSSLISGYTSGSGSPTADNIDKFPFAADGTATDVGDLSQARSSKGAGTTSTDNGYTAGGGTGDPVVDVDTIDKFPFSSDTNATDVGDLTQARRNVAGQSSRVSGYTTGGFCNPPPTEFNTIDKFPFTSDTNATDVGDITRNTRLSTGQQSTENGYNSGGFSQTAVVTKFPFATDSDSVSVGQLTQARSGGAGQSSVDNAYTSGGFLFPSPTPNPVLPVNTIDKFPFSTDTNATDVGDLSQTRQAAAGQQV